jgi:Acetyltransferases
MISGAAIVELRRFERADYPIYQRWFEDEALSQWLGSIDSQWLTHVLTEDGGAQYVLCEGHLMRAVVGVVYPSTLYPWYTISDLSVDPAVRRQGWARVAVQQVLKCYPRGATWYAYLDKKNTAAASFFTDLNWTKYTDLDTDMWLMRG